MRWGVVGTAAIALERVIPAMAASPVCEVVAIGSRDVARAEAAAARHAIPIAHGSYEALLADTAVEVLYNPLPNHLHVPWSVRALEAGKHVLCEKPLALAAADVPALIEARERTGLLVEEAFMVRDHPQWERLRAILEAGRLGEVRSVQLGYSHTALDPQDIRNRPDPGGGALYDVGSYCCAIARLVFGAEPRRALALSGEAPPAGVDGFTSGVLEFEGGHATFFCSMRSSRHQSVQVVGTAGWARIEVPFAHLPDVAARIVLGANVAPGTEPEETIRFEPVNQYRLQAERFSRLVRGEPAVERPIEDALANMRALDALRRAARSGRIEEV